MYLDVKTVDVEPRGSERCDGARDLLAFADERARPFLDLISRVEGEAGTIADLGCGPGHLTKVPLGPQDWASSGWTRPSR